MNKGNNKMSNEKQQKHIIEKQPVEVIIKTVYVTLNDDNNIITLKYPVPKNHSPMVPGVVSSIIFAENPPKIIIEIQEEKRIEYI